jgi:CoA:oxalate CoA-transferase
MGLLKGIRILDLTQMLAGPYGTMLLGDLGAEIIKIEPLVGDETREMPAPKVGDHSAYYLASNRMKKSIAINLKSEQGLRVFYDLVQESDVVFYNFRFGVPQRLKIQYEELKKIKPDIIVCWLTAFGLNGPYRDYPGYDLLVQAMSGGMSYTGFNDKPPVRAGIPIGDLGGGMFAALGIVSAIVRRQLSGEGCLVDISLLDGQISMLSYQAVYYLITGQLPKRAENGHPSAVVYDTFTTKDLDIVVIAHRDHFWEKFVHVIERPDWQDDERFATRSARAQNKEELTQLLNEIFKQKTSKDWLDALQIVGVPSGPVNTLKSALKDPQVIERNMVIELDHPSYGSFKAPGNPIKTRDKNGVLIEEQVTAPPLLGEHTLEVLSQVLSYDQETLAQLIRDNIVIFSVQ